MNTKYYNYNIPQIYKEREAYKRSIPSKAKYVLFYGNEDIWENKKFLPIAKRILKVTDKDIAGNLLNKFKGDTYHDDIKCEPALGRAAYTLFIDKRNEHEQEAFNKMLETGLNLCVISYLFFIYDDSKFMPIRKRYMNAALKELGYSNVESTYKSYIEYNKSLIDIQNKKGLKSLYDAHDFIWIIGNIIYKHIQI